MKHRTNNPGTSAPRLSIRDSYGLARAPWRPPES